jgi:hypothetical protein
MGDLHTVGHMRYGGHPRKNPELELDKADALSLANSIAKERHQKSAELQELGDEDDEPAPKKKGRTLTSEQRKRDDDAVGDQASKRNKVARSESGEDVRMSAGGDVDGTVLSETGFPSNAGTTNCAPHYTQGLSRPIRQTRHSVPLSAYVQ